MTQTTRKKRTELRIDTPEDLVLFAHAINKLHNEQQRDLLVTLTNDIDLTDVAWVPIGNEDIPFYGTFDGGGHSISGLHIDKREESAAVCSASARVLLKTSLSPAPSPASQRMSTPPRAAL